MGMTPYREPFDPLEILQTCLRAPSVWPGWGLMLLALMLAFRGRHGPALHLGLLAWQLALVEGLYAFRSSVSSISCGAPSNIGQVCVWGFAVPFVPLAVATPGLIWRARAGVAQLGRWPAALWAVGLLQTMAVVVGTMALLMSTSADAVPINILRLLGDG
jgi:hypothetical protein